jgi:hypothetical protein
MVESQTFHQLYIKFFLLVERKASLTIVGNDVAKKALHIGLQSINNHVE